MLQRKVRRRPEAWLRPAGHRLLRKYRQATWRIRSLPDFIIIGAQKCGTSSLYTYLAQHPQLVPSYIKETHYFDSGVEPDEDNYEKGEAWYRAYFPRSGSLRENCRTFEASPSYIFHPLAPQRIFELVPEAKLIVLLRDPTDRAVSHYFHMRQNGKEPLPIFEAMKAEEYRLESAPEPYYESPAFFRHTYKSRGRYWEQIVRYLEYFPPDSLLILSSRAFFRDPNATLQRVFEFAGVDPSFKVRDLTPRNVSHNRVRVNPDVYAYLDEYFRPHNQALYELLGRDFGWGNRHA